MNIPHSLTASKTKIGSCPHGLTTGACPICSGMSGGGGGSTKRAEKNEMSWDECYAIWQQMLKAKEFGQQKRNEAMQAQMQSSINFSGKMDNYSQKIASLIDKLSNFSQKTQSPQTILSKPLAVMAKIAIPVLNILKNIPALTQKTINFIQQKLSDISDKLNAVFGELKNAVEKKISEKLKIVKKKFKSFFGIFDNEEIDDKGIINELNNDILSIVNDTIKLPTEKTEIFQTENNLKQRFIETKRK